MTHKIIIGVVVFIFVWMTVFTCGVVRADGAVNTIDTRSCVTSKENNALSLYERRSIVTIQLDGPGEAGPPHTRMYHICGKSYARHRLVVVYNAYDRVRQAYKAHVRQIRTLDASDV